MFLLCCVSANERDKNDVRCNSEGPAVANTAYINSHGSCTGKGCSTQCRYHKILNISPGLLSFQGTILRLTCILGEGLFRVGLMLEGDLHFKMG